MSFYTVQLAALARAVERHTAERTGFCRQCEQPFLSTVTGAREFLCPSCRKLNQSAYQQLKNARRRKSKGPVEE